MELPPMKQVMKVRVCRHEHMTAVLSHEEAVFWPVLWLSLEINGAGAPILCRLRPADPAGGKASRKKTRFE